jgi:hypothetical protein
MTHSLTIKPLLLGSAALLFASMASAEGMQIDTDLDEGARHTSLGDLDGDGDLDLITSAWDSHAFAVFLGNGDGTFGPGSQIDTELDEGANHTSLGDLDGDGDLDLITSAFFSDAFTVFLTD